MSRLITQSWYGYIYQWLVENKSGLRIVNIMFNGCDYNGKTLPYSWFSQTELHAGNTALNLDLMRGF